MKGNIYIVTLIYQHDAAVAYINVGCFLQKKQAQSIKKKWESIIKTMKNDRSKRYKQRLENDIFPNWETTTYYEDDPEYDPLIDDMEFIDSVSEIYITKYEIGKDNLLENVNMFASNTFINEAKRINREVNINNIL
jgi:hypothetical protein